MKPARPLLFFFAMILLVGLACTFGQGTDTPAPPPATEKPIKIDEPTSAPVPTEPPATEAPVTEAPQPTQAPQELQYFTEEFDQPLSDSWHVLTVTGSEDADPEKVTLKTEDGKLVWSFDSKYVYYYLFYGAYQYEDVRLDVRADNRGKNNNNISLICRYDPEVGWYEFNIANSGLYDILYAQVTEDGKIAWNRIANGGSNSIKAGLETNDYSITCQGNELGLVINGKDVIKIKDKKFGLRKGEVGVSVSSFNVLPILIEMDYIKISQP